MLWFEKSRLMRIRFDGGSELLAGALGGSAHPSRNPSAPDRVGNPEAEVHGEGETTRGKPNLRPASASGQKVRLSASPLQNLATGLFLLILRDSRACSGSAKAIPLPWMQA